MSRPSCRAGSRESSCATQDGRRPVFGGSEKFQNDPHFRDYLLFYEYFHGDNGAGIGASHQTGWTALVAKLPSAKRRVAALRYPESCPQLIITTKLGRC